MAFAGHAVGQYTGPGHGRAIVLQSPCERAKGAGHGACIDDRQHMQAKALGQISRAGFAVKQPHDAFDDDQV